MDNDVSSCGPLIPKLRETKLQIHVLCRYTRSVSKTTPDIRTIPQKSLLERGGRRGFT